MMRRRVLTFGLSVVAGLSMAVAVWAYWSAAGPGSASASIDSLDAAAISVPATSAGATTIAWTQQASLSGNTAENGAITYMVERRLGAGSYAAVAGGDCAGALPRGTMSCADTVTVSGAYRYRVVAHYRSWTATSAEAGPVTANLDATPPAVQSIDRHGSSPANAAGVQFDVVFSEAVTGVDETDFSLATSGVSGAAVTSVTGSGSSYAVTVSTGTGSGSLRLDLHDDDSIGDLAGNRLGGSGTSGGGDGSFTGQAYAIDKTAPAVTVEQKSGQADPTNALAIRWTVTFSESVTDFDAGDLTRGGTSSGGTVTVTGSGTSYEISLAGSPTNGTVAFSIAAGKAADGAGNDNTASTSVDNTVTYDTVAPAVTLTSPADGSATASTTPTLSGAAGAAGGDANTVTVKIYSGTGTGGSVVQTLTPARSGASWTATPASLASGTYTAQATQGDTAGNSGTSSADTFRVDTTAPSVTVNQKSGQADPASMLPIRWTVTFSESVTGFDAGDLTRAGTSSGGTVTVTGSGASYEISLSGSPTTGTTTFSIAAGKAQDSAGNASTASTSTDNSVTYDAAPSLIALQMRDMNANGKVDQIRATFDENLASSSATAPWTLASVPSGGTLSSVSTSGATATLTLSEGSGAADTAVGSFTVALAAGATGIRDSAGNQSSFSATAPADLAAPVLLTATSTAGTTANRMQDGDSFALTFSEALAAGTVPSSVTVTESRSGIATLTIPGLISSSPEIDRAYLAANNSSAAADSGSLSRSADGKTITVVLGTLTTTGSGVGTGSGGVSSLGPATTLQDAAGNAAASTARSMSSLF